MADAAREALNLVDGVGASAQLKTHCVVATRVHLHE